MDVTARIQERDLALAIQDELGRISERTAKQTVDVSGEHDVEVVKEILQRTVATAHSGTE